jgi:Tol biopolymer transport system component
MIPVDAATGRATGPARQISMRPTVRFDDAPSFTPDDRFVVFASNTPDSGYVLVTPSNGGRERSLYSTAGEVSRALVSPDGRWVYFVAARALHRVPFGGGRAERLADGVMFFVGVSADGNRLAWYADGHPRAEATATIVVADATGKPLGALRDSRVKPKSWSSRPGVLLGRRIEFRHRTHIVPVAGGAVRTVGAIGRDEAPLGWSPDSRHLLVRRSCACPRDDCRRQWETARRATCERVAGVRAPGGAAAFAGDATATCRSSTRPDGSHSPHRPFPPTCSAATGSIGTASDGS